MVDVVIVGAGLTGLCAAYHLEKQAVFNYEIFEEAASQGGLLSSVQNNGFTFDHTGHFLHISQDEYKDFLQECLGLENCNFLSRNSFVFQHNRFIPFPYQSHIGHLPWDVAAECFKGFLYKSPRDTRSFKDWVLNHFGEGFYNNFFKPYNEKLLNTPLEELSSSWVSRFIPDTSIDSLIKNLITRESFSSAGYNPSFFYPKKGGIEALITGISKRISKKPCTESKLIKIDLQRKLLFFSNHSEGVPFNKLVSTIPLPELLQILKNDGMEQTYKDWSNNLKYNSVLNFNVGVEKPNLSEKHWIYFPEKEFPFYRIGFWHNFSEFMAPRGCSSFYGEISIPSLKATDSDVQKNVDSSVEAILKIFNASDAKILASSTLFLKYGYVVFDFWREENLSKILAHLQDNNIFSIGRFGAWKYSSMQEAYFDGKEVVGKLV